MPSKDFVTLIHSREQDELQKLLPWWKRPSPWWMLVLVPISYIALFAGIAPRIEVYTLLACREHRQAFGQTPQSAIFSQHNANALLHDEIPCVQDPAVQAAAAKLITAITLAGGVLSCLTVGYWGSFSDRHGRARVMAITLIAALVADAAYISVVRFYAILPGGSWPLVASAVLEGLLGVEAATQAYMADVTDESSRPRFFSLAMGLMLISVAVGPTIGSLLISKSHNALSAFYFGGILHLLLLIITFFVLPESVSMEKRQRSKEIYLRDLHNRSSGQEDQGPSSNGIAGLHRLLPFLRSLAVFLPTQEKNRNPLRRIKRDWSLTLVALGYGGAATATMGYYLSLIGLIFPIIVKYLKPKPVIIEIQDPSSSEVFKKEASLGLNVAVVLLSGLTESALVFTILSMIGSFGLGFSPAVQSAAIALYTRQGGVEVGRLFGSLGVVQAICGQLVGSFFFGVLYARTVASHPRAIFFVGAASLALAFICIAAIRVRENDGKQVAEDNLGESDPLLDNQ